MERWNRLTRSNLNLTHPHLLTETTNPRTSARYAATLNNFNTPPSIIEYHTSINVSINGKLTRKPIKGAKIGFIERKGVIALKNNYLLFRQVHLATLGYTSKTHTIYTISTYLIEILDRRKYNVDSIPQYNVTYTMARNLHLYKYPFPSCVVIEDVTQQANANASYSISDKDRQFLTRPDVFLHRTPPVDKDNKSDMSDESFKSAMDMPMEITPPPTPAHN
ncbi:hypothetical protein RirG_202510 [Rhizophagus irregularis DAOM 197198w]|uniref:Uncharacterized protein n=2 Tax=Rhizophagus irregularis TaxID=588596 RepID=A0A015KEA7_RHIIW|nr:hypothetical protein RirG_202510 [Rhizophagus irregularis DAOM 197198w]